SELHCDLLFPKWFRGELRELVRDFSKFEKTSFASEPACRAQSPSHKAITASRGVAERDGVFARIKADFVSARNRSSAIGAEAHGTRISAARDIFSECEKRARRRIFFRGVVNFPAPCAVCFFVCKTASCFSNDGAKMMQADGEIRAPDDAAVFRRGNFANLRYFLKPSCCARHHRDAKFDQAANILRCCNRGG